MRHEESLLRELYTAFDNRVVEEALGLPAVLLRVVEPAGTDIFS